MFFVRFVVRLARTPEKLPDKSVLGGRRSARADRQVRESDKPSERRPEVQLAGKASGRREIFTFSSYSLARSPTRAQAPLVQQTAHGSSEPGVRVQFLHGAPWRSAGAGASKKFIQHQTIQTQTMQNPKAIAEKRLRALHRELKTLQQRRWHPPVHELAEPIQRGWKRHFVLSADTHARPDAPILAAILEAINVVRYFWRRDFQPPRRAVRAGGQHFFTDQELRAIGLGEWPRHNYPDVWHEYFSLELVPEALVNQRDEDLRRRYRWVRPGLWQRRRGHVLAYRFRYPRLFVLRVEKRWLTHVSEIEPEIIERIAEIERWMDHHHGRPIFGRLKGRSQGRRWHGTNERLREPEKAARREMRAHLGFLHAVAAAETISSRRALAREWAGRFQPLWLVRQSSAQSFFSERNLRRRRRIPGLDRSRPDASNRSTQNRQERQPERRALRLVKRRTHRRFSNSRPRRRGRIPARRNVYPRRVSVRGRKREAGILSWSRRRKVDSVAINLFLSHA